MIASSLFLNSGVKVFSTASSTADSEIRSPPKPIKGFPILEEPALLVIIRIILLKAAFLP